MFFETRYIFNCIVNLFFFKKYFSLYLSQIFKYGPCHIVVRIKRFDWIKITYVINSAHVPLSHCPAAIQSATSKCPVGKRFQNCSVITWNFLFKTALQSDKILFFFKNVPNRNLVVTSHCAISLVEFWWKITVSWDYLNGEYIDNDSDYNDLLY